MKYQVTETIETKIGRISLLSNGIVRVEGHSDIEIELEDMKENEAAFKKLLGENDAPFLVIFGENALISFEAREYFANKDRSRIKRAEALIVSQTHHRMIARFHENVYKPAVPTKIFQDEDEAIAWLTMYL